MPRVSTIKQLDVDSICERLLASGKTPTLRLIIAEHGSGSQSTVQPLLKDWQRRQDAVAPTAPEHILSDELLRSLTKHFAHDVRVAAAELKDKLDASEEANGDLARENSALEARLRQCEAELVALSDQDAVIRGQAVQLENDLARSRKDYEEEKSARLACEREAAGTQAQLADARARLAVLNDALTQGAERESALAAEVAAARITAGTLQGRLDAAGEVNAALHAELVAARQRQQEALETAAELRGRLREQGK